ncbi:histidine phosphatase family protein [Prolixibacter sp. SD074]|uniref:SixA phosphatase family protein n=1 Tax=Prolixibacter sp. SD074 TaxID=2652391 RepID=UPI00126DAAB1|nr:histidine phosphatase family protein [Prolixibacter sp. SD074]GET29576.1 phosphohistidine phosphatase SixA [Prolixibacter sp. SD074]
MKLVVLVRHGKAEHTNDPKPDYRRNLTTRGEADATRIAEEIKPMLPQPLHLISSPANRAKQTATFFASVLDYPEDAIQEEEDLYDGLTTTEFLEMLAKTPEESDCILVFGHNPAQTILADRMLNHFDRILPTSGAVAIRFGVQSWAEIEPRSGELAFYKYPKMFR